MIIQVKKLTKSYKMGKTRLEVLKGVDFSTEKGQFVAVVGASGSGKSTLLHILGALDKPDAGTVEYNQKQLSSFKFGKLNHYRNQIIGFVFQFYHLLDELTVLENVIAPAMASAGLAGWMKIKSKTKEKAYMLLDRLGLNNRTRHRPFELSGGERQRVAIARALINDPELLLADEPTGNLDSKTGYGILSILKELNDEGQTIIMVTHDDRIASQANRIVRLADGKVQDSTA